MNWTRVKTILIWLFAAVNIMLIANIIMMFGSTASISPAVVSDTVNVLKRNGISINPAMIPTRAESMKTHEAVNVISSPDKLASSLLGSGYSQKSEGVYTNGDKILTIKGGGFVFESANPSDAEFTKEDVTSSDVLAYLKDKGFDVAHVLIGEPVKVETHFETQFTKTVDGRKLFESEIKVVVIPKKGISKLEGVWLNPTDNGGFMWRDNIILRQVTGILVDLLRNPDFPKNQDISITEIELGYSAGGGQSGVEHKVMTIIPAYRIYTSDGKYYMYDARNGEYWKQ